MPPATRDEESTGRFARLETQVEGLREQMRDHVVEDRGQFDRLRDSIESLREVVTKSRISLAGLVALAAASGSIIVALIEHFLLGGHS